MKKYKIKKNNNAVLNGNKLHVMKATENMVVYAPDNETVTEKADNKLTKEEKDAVKLQRKISKK